MPRAEQPPGGATSSLASAFVTRTTPCTTSLDDQPESVPVLHWPSPITAAAHHGLAGDVVRVLAPHSEADPAALLVQFVAAAGNYLGRVPYFLIEGDRHYGNLFVLLLGPTATGRKGTSWGQVRRILAAADSTYVRSNIKGGLASGEGLIYHVRDTTQRVTTSRAGDGTLAADPGVTDKRLLVLETEFAGTLRVMARDGNTLSARVRQAWETGTLSTLTRGDPLTATDAHISVIAHITPDELRRRLGDEQLANGFANRFVFVAARRSQYLPHGSEPAASAVRDLGARLHSVRERYRQLSGPVRLERDPVARAVWERCYRSLADGAPGLVGAVTSRGAAQVMRLAVVYAALDASDEITERHLEAARAVWAYSVDSATYVFGHKLADESVDRVQRVLCDVSGWIARTAINKQLAGHVSSAEIARALRTLQEMGRAVMKTISTSGRPAEMWCDAEKAEEAEEGRRSLTDPAAPSPSSAFSASSANLGHLNVPAHQSWGRTRRLDPAPAQEPEEII